MYKGDFHIHSKHSYDSNMEPERILKTASKLGMNVISISDHESMGGSLEALELSSKYGIEVWPGMEIASDCGDILGIRIKEEITSRKWEDVIYDIKEQGGTAILPHPFRSHRKIEELAAKVDLIEVFNGRDSPSSVKKAADLAKRHSKPGIAGSDAHTYPELGNAINTFDDLFSMEKTFIGKSSNRFQRTYSYLVKDMKKGTYSSIPRDLLRIIR